MWSVIATYRYIILRTLQGAVIFAHDRVQEAASSLKQGDPKTVHLLIGDLLLERGPINSDSPASSGFSEDRVDRQFELLDHFNHAYGLDDSDLTQQHFKDRRLTLIKLNLAAGL